MDIFTSEDNQDAVLRTCQEEVAALVVERGWHLLEPPEWVAETMSQVRIGSIANPRRAAVHVYSHAMHAACSGFEGQERREQAYDELFRFLLAYARKRFPQVYDDVAQQAVEFVIDRFVYCRKPGAFLTFALYQLLAAARTVNRQHDLHLRGADSATLEDRVVAEALRDRQPDLSAPFITAELRASFERLAGEFLREHPRAEMQLAALRLKYIDALDDAAISARLGKPTSSVYVLRSRAIEKLRAKPEWRALAVEFGILPE